jgi:flagellar biosynthetic protein FliO
MSGTLAVSSATTQIGSLLWQVFYFLFMLGLVVLMSIVVTRWWVKRSGPGAPKPGRNLELLEFMPLGSGKGLYLVRVPEAIWLVGVTEHGINLLREYPPTVELTAVVKGNSALPMPNWLTQLVSPKAKQEETAKRTSREENEFTRQLMERLQQLKEPRE